MSRSGFIYSRSSGAEHIRDEEDTGLAAMDGQGGAKGQGPDHGMKGPYASSQTSMLLGETVAQISSENKYKAIKSQKMGQSV